MGKELREQDELLTETFGEPGDPNPGMQKKDEKPEPEEPETPQEPEEPETPEEPEEPEATEDDILDYLSGRKDVAEESEDPEEPEEPETPEEPEEPETPEEPEEFEAYDLTEEEYEEITSSPEKFAEFATQLRKEAQADALKQVRAEFKQELANAKEEILRNIPEVVQKSAKRAQSVQQLRDNFFEENPALKQKLPYVRDMTATVATQNPDWSAQQVLGEVANRAYRDLDLSKQAKEREQERKTNDPKFAGAGGRRSPSGEKDTRTKQEKILDQTFGTNR